MKNKSFISGLQLSEEFYTTEVQPILRNHFPGVRHSAGLLGHGSEVLGFDTALSTDHDWGPRIILFLDPVDFHKKEEISKVLETNLPSTFLGYSVRPNNSSDVRKEETEKISTRHRVEITTIRVFFKKELGVDPYVNLNALGWLTFSSQRLLSVTAGGVFYDGLEELHIVRGRFSYYPQNVWLYILAAQWHRISQEDSFMGRAGDVSDEIGSHIIGARLIKYVMELCFMMERKYIPYIKWFGTSFSKLECSDELTPLLKKVLATRDWKNREKSLSLVYEFIAEKHNILGVTEALPVQVSTFFDRPYLVIQASAFAQALQKKITDRTLKGMRLIGSIDQFADSTDVVDNQLLSQSSKTILQASAREFSREGGSNVVQ